MTQIQASGASREKPPPRSTRWSRRSSASPTPQKSCSTSRIARCAKKSSPVLPRWKKRHRRSQPHELYVIQSSAEIYPDVLGHRADDIGKIIEVTDEISPNRPTCSQLNAAIEAARVYELRPGICRRRRRSPQARRHLDATYERNRRPHPEYPARSTPGRRKHEAQHPSLKRASASAQRSSAPHYTKSPTSSLKSTNSPKKSPAATAEQSVGSSQIAKATGRLTEITQEINSAVEEQASGAQAVVRAMDKMRELVQQFRASSSTELSAAAEQMLKLLAQPPRQHGPFRFRQHRARKLARAAKRRPLILDAVTRNAMRKANTPSSRAPNP